MDIINKNKKSGFPLFIRDIDRTKPHTFIYEDVKGRKYVVSWDGTKGTNCVRCGDDLKAIFQNHRFAEGQITVEYHATIYDADFADGQYPEVDRRKAPIFITNGPSNEASPVQHLPITVLPFSNWSPDEQNKLADKVATRMMQGNEGGLLTITDGKIYLNISSSDVDE